MGLIFARQHIRQPLGIRNMLNLTPQLKSQIRSHAQEENSVEVCGFVLENKETVVFRARNVAENPRHNFSICPKSYLEASMLGDIKAVYHSHVSDRYEFSEKDKINLRAHNLPGVLYLLKTDQFLQSDYIDLGVKYVGCSFEIGKRDCYTLCQDYFKQELNLEISKYQYNDNWAKVSPDLYEKNYEKEGFIKIQDAPIDVSKLKLHDVLLVKFLPIPYASHTLIYLGDNQVLHHPRNKVSTVELLTNSMIKRVKFVVRHKSLCRN